MSGTFSKEEKAAMRAAAKEAKAAKANADLAAACAEAIDEMTGSDKEMASVLHELVAKHTDLKPKTWYGMPAYTNADGKVVVFFQSAAKFGVRYATIGFQEAAKLDDGDFWPNAYAVTNLGADDKKRLIALLEKATA